MTVFNCKELAAREKAELKEKIKGLSKTPELKVFSIGDLDAPSQIYVRNKLKACAEVGIQAEYIKLDKDDLKRNFVFAQLFVQQECERTYGGVIVQKQKDDNNLDFELLTQGIPYSNDVDCLSVGSMGRLFMGSTGLMPATVKGIMMIIFEIAKYVRGKSVGIIGRSNIVGRPMAAVLEHYDATVTLYHSKSDWREDLKRHDIVIVAAGVPGLVTPEDVRKDALVIDAGINRLESGLVGDFDPTAIKGSPDDYDITYTPVPGGVGVMTVTALLHNVWQACDTADRHKRTTGGYHA